MSRFNLQELPRNTWADGGTHDAAAKRLAGLFRGNFTTYERESPAEVAAAGPAM